MGTLITDLFSGFTDTISGVASGVKTAFMQLLYVDPAAETKVVADLPKFLFVMLGLSMAIGITYTIFKLIKRHR